MSTKDSGIDMYEDEEVSQRNGSDAAVEASGAEMTGDASMADPVSVDTGAVAPADASHAPISPSEDTAHDSAGALENAPTIMETGKEPHKEAPTYSEEYVNLLKSQHERDRQSCENRLREVENELTKREEKIHVLYNERYERDKRMSYWFSLVDDGSPAKINELIKKTVEFQFEVDKVKNDYDELLKTKETFEKWYTETHQENLALHADLDTSRKDIEQKTKELEQKTRELEKAISVNDELFARCEVGERVLKSTAPACLVSAEWFEAFFSELKVGLQKEPVFDPAMLVFASLAELAVMERSSVAPCFEWKKLLADIGLVVANYMHQKKSAEGDVLKVLRDFAQAFQGMPILKKLKIVCKVPSLGEDFNVDEVKHRNNGSSIAKVLNWCIVEDGHVYCKAIVE